MPVPVPLSTTIINELSNRCRAPPLLPHAHPACSARCLGTWAGPASSARATSPPSAWSATTGACDRARTHACMHSRFAAAQQHQTQHSLPPLVFVLTRGGATPPTPLPASTGRANSPLACTPPTAAAASTAPTSTATRATASAESAASAAGACADAPRVCRLLPKLLTEWVAWPWQVPSLLSTYPPPTPPLM